MSAAHDTPTEEETKTLNKFGFKLNTAYMEVPRCSNCEFYTPLTENSGHSVALGTCSLIPVGKSGIKPYYCEGLYVLASFGCIHYERKDHVK